MMTLRRGEAAQWQLRSENNEVGDNLPSDKQPTDSIPLGECTRRSNEEDIWVR